MTTVSDTFQRPRPRSLVNLPAIQSLGSASRTPLAPRSLWHTKTICAARSWYIYLSY